MNNLNRILLVGFALVALSQCKPNYGNECPPTKTTTRNLTDADKAKIPYSGTDTVAFVSSSNETIVFVGLGKDSWHQEFPDYSSSAGNCPIDKINHESCTIVFKDQKGTASFAIEQTTQDDITNIVFNGESFNYTTWDMDNKSSHITLHNDSMLVNGKVYYNVIGPTFSENGYHNAFYSIQYGLIQVVNTIDNSTWSRVDR